MNRLFRPLIVRRLISKLLRLRLHAHVIQTGPNTYRKNGNAHWHRRHNPHYMEHQGYNEYHR